MREFRGTSKVFFSGLLACVLSATITAAAGVEVSITVKVSEPFEVNGTLYPAGRLQLKSMRDYNPSQSINELWLNHECLGYFLARKGGEDPSLSRSDTMFFTRSPQGHLVLVGYMLTGQGSNKLFRYEDTGGKSHWAAPRNSEEPAFTTASLR